MPSPAEHNPQDPSPGRGFEHGDPAPTPDVGELVLVKDGRRYVFRCAAGEEKNLLDELAAMARDPLHELTWFDAAVLSHQMGRNLQQTLGGLSKAS